MKKKKRSNPRLVHEALVMVLQLGLNMIIPILICTAAGMLIDAKITHGKTATLVAIIIGIIAGINGVYRQVKVYLKQVDKQGSKKG